MFNNPSPVFTLAEAEPSTRARFIRRVYAHVAMAILAFVILETFLLSLPISAKLSIMVLEMPFGWLMVMGGFIGAGWLARGMASVSESKVIQYMGLGLYVVAQAIIFVPLLLIAIGVGGPQLIAQAGIITLLLVGGLTATVFLTRADFSFLGSIITMAMFVSLGLIIAGIFFGFNLGLWFSVAMVLVAGGAILYDTSNILHKSREDQYVGAALELFASIALLFWYVVRILIALSGRD